MNKYNLIFWAVSHVDKTLEEPTLCNGSVDRPQNHSVIADLHIKLKINIT